MNTQESNKIASNMTVREFRNRNKFSSNVSDTSSSNDVDMSTTVRIPVNKLKSTNMAQRVFKKPHVEEIIDNFDKNQLQPIVVSFRDGIYYIVDGDHRTAAVRVKFGNDYLMECKVVNGLTEKQEADLFVKLNENRIPLTASEDARGKFYAGEQQILDLYNICKKNHCIFDIKVQENSNDDDIEDKSDWRKVKCIKAMERTYEGLGYNYDDMFRIIKLLNTTWADDKDTFQEPMIKMMAVLIKTYGDEMVDKTFISRLSASPDHTPSKLIYAGREDRFTKAKLEKRMARIAVYQYNTAKGRTKKLEINKLGI